MLGSNMRVNRPAPQRARTLSHAFSTDTDTRNEAGGGTRLAQLDDSVGAEVEDDDSIVCGEERKKERKKERKWRGGSMKGKARKGVVRM